MSYAGDLLRSFREEMGLSRGKFVGNYGLITLSVGRLRRIETGDGRMKPYDLDELVKAGLVIADSEQYTHFLRAIIADESPTAETKFMTAFPAESSVNARLERIEASINAMALVSEESAKGKDLENMARAVHRLDSKCQNLKSEMAELEVLKNRSAWIMRFLMMFSRCVGQAFLDLFDAIDEPEKARKVAEEYNTSIEEFLEKEGKGLS